MTDPLYPIPENPEATKFIFGRSRNKRDEHGTMLLLTPLSMAEREIIHKRLHAIAEPLAAAKPAALRKVLLGAIPGDDAEAAKMRAALLAKEMDGLPLFAVARAAEGFKNRGQDLPPPAELRMAAEAIVRPYWNEAAISSMLLRAKIDPHARPDGPAATRIGAGFADLREQIDGMTAADEEAEARRAGARAQVMPTKDDFIAREYRRLGLEPVYIDKARTMMTSLDALLRAGWRIEEMQGENVLVRPDGRRHREEERTDG